MQFKCQCGAGLRVPDDKAGRKGTCPKCGISIVVPNAPSKKLSTLIYQNPFRVLGLPVTATDREIVKSISDLSIFMEMGKTKEFDCDHFFPARPHRTSESIANASRKIEQPGNKLFYALFWFWENPANTIDEMAFEELKRGNVDRAIQFWLKETTNGITTKNSSNHKNLAVLYLGLSSENGKLNKTRFMESLELSGNFLANSHFEQFIKDVVGSRHSIDHLEIVNAYVDEIILLAKPHLDKPDGLKTRELIATFSSYPGDVQNVIMDKFVGKHIRNIDRQIKISENRRKNNASEANKAGFELYEKTEEDMKYIKTVLSESDLKFRLTADKLANEIVQCSICYFNEFQDSTTDPGDDALQLAKYAKSIAVGEKVNERIDEGMPILKKHVAEKPKRERLKPVKEELDYIYKKINGLQAAKSTPSVANAFAIACREKLNSIKDKLDKTDAGYLEISDLVVTVAIGMCVKYLGAAAQGSSNPAARLLGLPTISPFEVRRLLGEVQLTFNTVGKFDMSSSTRSQYKELCTKLRLTPTSPSGCYIATMVYGSYSAPEVLVLRKFRDEVLQRSWIGRAFIKLYYKYSPSFVEKTRNLKRTHIIFKSILNPIVRYLKANDE